MVVSPQVWASLLGASDESLRSVLREVLDELGIALDCSINILNPDLVLADVGEEDPAKVLAAARLLARHAPILAILPIQDERLAAQAHALGATACFAMGMPLDDLRATVEQLLLEAAVPGRKFTIR